MAWEPAGARSRTREFVARLGFPQPPDWYPSIERHRLRGVTEVEDRALVLNVVITALAWGLSLAPALNWDSYCGDELASWLPNLRTSEDPSRFRSSTVLRTDAEVLDELDVAFCLTWGCAEANLRQQPAPGDVRDYVIWERRRALEWLMADDWDNPNYDT